MALLGRAVVHGPTSLQFAGKDHISQEHCKNKSLPKSTIFYKELVGEANQPQIMFKEMGNLVD